MSIQPSPDPELNFAALAAEQAEIMKEQASGLWDKLEKEDPLRLAARIKRGIEITALLRRSNTGPAKPGSKRSKKVVDIESIRDELLK